MKLDEGNILCEVCGKRIEDYNTRKYCKKCADEKERIRKREWKRKSKSKGSENDKTCTP